MSTPALSGRTALVAGAASGIGLAVARPPGRGRRGDDRARMRRARRDSSCIDPASVRTPLVEHQVADRASTHGLSEDEVVEQMMLGPDAIGRLIEPEEDAELASYLCRS